MDIPRPRGTMTTQAAANQRLPWTSVSLNVASTLVETAVKRWPLPWHWLAAAGVALAVLVLGARPAQAAESRPGPRTSSAASVTPASQTGRQGIAAGPVVTGPATVPPAASRPAAVGAPQPPAAPPPAAPPPVVIAPPAAPPTSSNPGVPAGRPQQPPPTQRPPHPTPAPQHHGQPPSTAPAGIPAGGSVQPPAGAVLPPPVSAASADAAGSTSPRAGRLTGPMRMVTRPNHSSQVRAGKELISPLPKTGGSQWASWFGPRGGSVGRYPGFVDDRTPAADVVGSDGGLPPVPNGPRWPGVPWPPSSLLEGHTPSLGGPGFSAPWAALLMGLLGLLYLNRTRFGPPTTWRRVALISSIERPG
jgi:hypothetical protein